MGTRRAFGSVLMSESRRFTSADRALVESDVIEVLTLGLDIGSATSHVSISRLTMVRGHNRYTVSNTEVVYQSPVMKTPFGGDGRAFIIRTELESMIDESLLKADVDRDDIESGVVILTGNALRRHNARQIADLLASFSGSLSRSVPETGSSRPWRPLVQVLSRSRWGRLPERGYRWWDDKDYTVCRWQDF